MKTYQGSCHCGDISFTFEAEDIVDGVRCNCSICKRKGALMTAFNVPMEKIKVSVKGRAVDDFTDAALGLYQFDSRKAKHFFCNNCGIYPFHETMRFPGQYRVNLGCVEGVDTFALPFKVFDGAAL